MKSSLKRKLLVVGFSDIEVVEIAEAQSFGVSSFESISIMSNVILFCFKPIIHGWIQDNIVRIINWFNNLVIHRLRLRNLPGRLVLRFLLRSQ